MNGLAPIIIFAFKRIDSLKNLLSSLQRNREASQSDLFIFSDGPRNSAEEKKVIEVRRYINSIVGFNSVTVRCSEKNKGLAKSVIDGVSEVLKERGKVIVVEDDLLVSDNFLSFMNQALEYYNNYMEILSISGFTYPVRRQENADVYFTKRACSTGWATWKDKWTSVDWEGKAFESFKKNITQQRQFNKMGSDLAGLLFKQREGIIDSWAITWIFHQYKKNLYTVYPTTSKVKIFGLDEFATHTKLKWDRYKTVLDVSALDSFKFDSEVKLNPFYIKQFVFRFSIPKRIFNKIMDFIS